MDRVVEDLKGGALVFFILAAEKCSVQVRESVVCPAALLRILVLWNSAAV